MGAVKAARERYHHGALESALVDEAFAEVRSHGAGRVSLRQVAQAVGVSASAAYQYFPDKAGLMWAVCERSFDLLADRMRAAADAEDAEGAAGAVARFVALGRAYVAFAAEEPHLFRQMFAGDQRHPPDDVGPCPPSLPEDHRKDSGAYALLLQAIADLDEYGLLSDGATAEQGLDVLIWSLVHGFAALVVDGNLPIEAGPLVLGLFSRLVLCDGAPTGPNREIQPR